MNVITVHKINDEVVKPIRKPAYKKKNVIGKELFEEPYANIFICSKKKSGKTTLISKILKSCANKTTHVIIFCSTVHKDANYKTILDDLEKKGIQTTAYTSIVDHGVDQLQQIIDPLTEKDPIDNQPKQKKIKFISFDGDGADDDDDDDKPKKSKTVAPEYIFVFDDLNNEINNKNLAYLISRNRHFLCKVIISSQYYNALSKSARANIDYILLFKNLPDEKLKLIAEEADLTIDWDMFHKLYKDATSTPYSFFYVDVQGNYRKSFNKQYFITDQ